jgi:hypothetical protein
MYLEASKGLSGNISEEKQLINEVKPVWFLCRISWNKEDHNTSLREPLKKYTRETSSRRKPGTPS